MRDILAMCFGAQIIMTLNTALTNRPYAALLQAALTIVTGICWLTLYNLRADA